MAETTPASSPELVDAVHFERLNAVRTVATDSLWMDRDGQLRLGLSDRIALAHDIPSDFHARFMYADVQLELTAAQARVYGLLEAGRAKVGFIEVKDLNVSGTPTFQDIVAANVSSSSVNTQVVTSKSAFMDSIVISGRTQTESLWTDESNSKRVVCSGDLSAVGITAAHGVLASLTIGDASYEDGSATDKKHMANLRSPLSLFLSSIRSGALDSLSGYENRMLHVTGPSFNIRLFAPAVFGTMDLADAKRLASVLTDVAKDMNQATMSLFEEHAHIGFASNNHVQRIGSIVEVFCCAVELAKAIHKLGITPFHAHKWQWMADHIASSIRSLAVGLTAATWNGQPNIFPHDIIQFASNHVPIADSYAPDDPYVSIVCDLCIVMCKMMKTGCFMSTLSCMHWSLGLAVNKRMQSSPLTSNGFLASEAQDTSIDSIRMPYSVHATRLEYAARSKTLSSSNASANDEDRDDKLVSLGQIWSRHAIAQADFGLVIEGTEADFIVHSWLMAGIWPYFRRVLQASLAEASERRLAFESSRFPASALVNLVNFVYGAQIGGGEDTSWTSDNALVEEFELDFLRSSLNNARCH
jgi:hypothetical protein